MAAEKKNSVSFDAIIQADRNRRKNEQLASEIFGRSKQNKDDRRQNSRSFPQTPSLASRIGVAKTQRSSSSTSVSSQRPKPPSRPSSTAAQRDRSNRLASALNSEQANINPFSPKLQPSSRGLSIKGKAGPFPVIASNFAPGTTAADIESAVAIESTDSEGQNGLLSCRLTSEHPSVVAELVFSERTIADRIISTYNNQRADGRVLRLLHKKSSTTSLAQPLPSSDTPIQDKEEDVDMMATEPPTTSDSLDPTSSRYDTDREAANRERESSRRGGAPVEPDVVEDVYDSSTRPTEPNTEDRNGGSRRDDDRERERDRDRDRDRDGERDRDRDRRYDDRSYERRDDRDRDRERDRDRDRERRYDSRGSYGGRPSHYGNGVGGAGMGGGPGPGPTGPRGGGGYGGFPGRGGRMYSDEMMRGRGGMRGGYRGGYR